MKTKKYSIISLDKFIAKSLYEKNTGYYMSKNPFGKKGDFVTSPNISIFFSEIIAWTFTKDILVQELIKEFFWIVHFGFSFQGISMLISASCNALNHPLHSTLINIIKLFVFLVPSVYLGSKIWGSTGFFLGIAFGNLATGTIAWLWFKKYILPHTLKI